jgi:hypothetical protein
MIEGLSEEWNPRPIWVWMADAIGLLLVAVNAVCWPLLILVLLS